MVEFYGGDRVESNPFDVVHRWIEAAQLSGEAEPTAVNLATVDPDGLPDLRVVYIREIDESGFIFYTNYQSAKGQELASGKAALNYYFPKWQRQIRIRGLAEKLSSEKSDAYFLARPQLSRIGAWMSQQSRPVDSRELMEEEMNTLDMKIAEKRPPHWGGYRVIPLQIEFWSMGEHRVHDRFQWRRADVSSSWQLTRLYP